MQLFLLIFLSVLLLATLGVVFLMYNKMKSMTASQQPQDQLFGLLQNQMEALTKTMDNRIEQTNKSMNDSQRHMHQVLQDQFAQNTRMIQGITGQSTKMISEITEKLTSLDKTNQQVVNFSEQLTNLEKVLTSQKKRGNLGEAGLQLVLENILPPTAFAFQHTFADGDIVDAAIFTKDGIIPVDAKFPLDNYNRLVHEADETRKAQLETDFKNDLKKRIDETSKYIKPKEGTLDFAFMFIPAEAIYYDLLVNEVGAVKVNTRSLIDYAFNERKVIIVSPTTFAAYLQTVLQGLRALKIEESAMVIRQNVQKLEKHIRAYESFMKKLGASLSTSVNHYNTAYKELGKVEKDVIKITEGEKSMEPMHLERPQLDE